MGNPPNWEDLLEKVDADEIDGLWVSGGYKTDWNDAQTAERFADIKLLVVQDLFTSPLLIAAHYQLPATAFPEHDGSYVSFADRLQSFRWAIRPPSGVRPEAGLCWDLLGGGGMYNARARPRRGLPRDYVFQCRQR